MDPFVHGPSTNISGGTDGKMIFLVPQPHGGEGTDNPITQMTTPHYSKSDARCQLHAWYYISGNVGGNGLTPFVRHGLADENLVLDLLMGPRDGAKYWKLMIVGMGETTQFNVRETSVMV
jgi:hypothetical protein